MVAIRCYECERSAEHGLFATIDGISSTAAILSVHFPASGLHVMGLPNPAIANAVVPRPTQTSATTGGVPILAGHVNGTVDTVSDHERIDGIDLALDADGLRVAGGSQAP